MEPPASNPSLLNQREGQSFLFHLRNRNTDLPTTAGGPGKPSSLMSLEEARMIQLRNEHPEYNAFMLEMTLYQEQQAARERNRAEREVLERKKEKRLAARLRAVEDLVSLPQLRDGKGNPVPLDKKAFAWLHEFHPELAQKWMKLVGLSMHITEQKQRPSPRAGGSPPSNTSGSSLLHQQQQPPERFMTVEEIQERAVQQEQDILTALNEHVKRHKEVQSAQVARSAWFRTQYETRAKAVHEKRYEAAKQLAASARNSTHHEELVLERRAHALGERSEAIRRRLDDSQSVHEARRKQAEAQEEAAATLLLSSEEYRLDRVRKQREEEARQRVEEHEEMRREHQRRMEQLSTKEREKILAQLHAAEKADAAVEIIQKEKAATTEYFRRQHFEKAHKVLSKAISEIDESLADKTKLLHDTYAKIETASVRRQAHTNPSHSPGRGGSSTSAGGVDDGASGSETSPRSATTTTTTSSPRYAQATGKVSENRRNLARLASMCTAQASTPRKPLIDATDVAEAHRLEEQKQYDAKLHDLNAKDRRLREAEKRRQEIVGEYIIDPARQRAIKEEAVRRKHQEELAQLEDARKQKLLVEESKTRCFVPRPPKIWSGPKVPRREAEQLDNAGHSSTTLPASPPRDASPRNKEFFEKWESRLITNRERVEAAELHRREILEEEHEQEVRKEEAAAALRRDIVKSQAEQLAAVAEDRAKKFESSRQRMFDDSKQSRSLKHSKEVIEHASSRRQARVDDAARAVHEAQVQRAAAAVARRAEEARKKERCVLEDVEQRQRRHREMFSI